MWSSRGRRAGDADPASVKLRADPGVAASDLRPQASGGLRTSATGALKRTASLTAPAGRSSQPGDRCGWLVLVAIVTALARPLAAQAPPLTGAEDGPSSKTEIFNAMQEVRRKYGSDAVMLEGHLLNHAVRNGSVGAAAVSVGGFEARAGKRWLAVQLETGIVYNDREVGAAARPARVWSEIIEASLRKFRSLTLPADGIALTLGYAHRAYDDEAELRAHLRDQPGTPETAVFYLLLPDIGDLVADRITGQQLIERSATLLNGAAAHIVLALPTPAGEALTH